MNYILFDNNYRYYYKLKHLYEHAFPSEERPPLSMLLEMSNSSMYAVEDNGEFVGLVSTVNYSDLVYIFFLAVKKRYRHKGYGTRILKDINVKYADKRIFLLAEDPDIPSDNQEERNNRIKFYNHNGMKVTGNKVTEYGVDYIFLSNGKDVSKEDFLKVMEYITGDFFPIYTSHVK